MEKVWADEAWDDYLYWQMQDKKTLKKIKYEIAQVPFVYRWRSSRSTCTDAHLRAYSPVHWHCFNALCNWLC